MNFIRAILLYSGDFKGEKVSANLPIDHFYYMHSVVHVTSIT